MNDFIYETAEGAIVKVLGFSQEAIAANREIQFVSRVTERIPGQPGETNLHYMSRVLNALRKNPSYHGTTIYCANVDGMPRLITANAADELTGTDIQMTSAIVI